MQSENNAFKNGKSTIDLHHGTTTINGIMTSIFLEFVRVYLC